jgi:hypothetical protein
VGVAGCRHGGPRRDDVGEGLVGGDLPRDHHVGIGHPAAVQRLGRQAGPEDHAVRERVPARDPQRERIGGQRLVDPGERRTEAGAQEGDPGDRTDRAADERPPRHRRGLLCFVFPHAAAR